MIAKVDSTLQNKDLILCRRSSFISNVHRDYQTGHIGSLLVASSALKVLPYNHCHDALCASINLLVLSPKSAFAPIQYMGSVSWQASAYVYAKTHRCIQLGATSIVP